jgi:hypothetical protein
MPLHAMHLYQPGKFLLPPGPVTRPIYPRPSIRIRQPRGYQSNKTVELPPISNPNPFLLPASSLRRTQPSHHPPGVNRPSERCRSSRSILSRTLSSWETSAQMERHSGHFVEVTRGEDMGMLLWRIIPSDVVQVVASCSTPKLLGVVDNCVEIAFW